jgi:restriction endonuclease Mrr
MATRRKTTLTSDLRGRPICGLFFGSAECDLTANGGESMGERRADRIAKVLEENAGRLHVSDILRRLCDLEGNQDIALPALYQAIQNENERLREVGERPRFKTSKQGEARGWVSLEAESEFAADSVASDIESRVLRANKQVDKALHDRLKKMHWRVFESTFLTAVLERLGFQDVQVTQATHDGGVDARVVYKRGLVEARAVISAKRWATNSVPVDEVRNMRGIKGDEDTAIIVTTGRFTREAQEEAKPGQNQRVVYLIDGDRLVEICKQYEIGITRTSLPPILTIDEEQFSGFEAEDEPNEGDANHSLEPQAIVGVKRFRDEMLGDSQAGVSAREIASLLGLTEGSVRTYLSIPERRAALGDRIRADPDIRRKALALVAGRRGGSPPTADPEDSYD